MQIKKICIHVSNKLKHGFQARPCFQLGFHWVSKLIHLTRIRCSGWVRATWIINEFEKVIYRTGRFFTRKFKVNFHSEWIVIRKCISLKIRFHRKFDIFSSKSQEKPRISAKYICITFAQYCTCQSMMLLVWSVKSDWSVKPSWIRVKFVISHWSVSMNLLLVVRIQFVGFVIVLDKSFVSKAPVLVDIC